MFPCTRAPFWYHFFEPQPFGKSSQICRELYIPIKAKYGARATENGRVSLNMYVLNVSSLLCCIVRMFSGLCRKQTCTGGCLWCSCAGHPQLHLSLVVKQQTQWRYGQPTKRMVKQNPEQRLETSLCVNRTSWTCPRATGLVERLLRRSPCQPLCFNERSEELPSRFRCTSGPEHLLPCAFLVTRLLGALAVLIS